MPTGAAAVSRPAPALTRRRANPVLVSTLAPLGNVVDTVWAGDTLMKALLDGLIEADLIGADRRAALRDIPLALLEQIMRRSADAAAVTVSRPGADPPTLAELAAS